MVDSVFISKPMQGKIDGILTGTTHLSSSQLVKFAPDFGTFVDTHRDQPHVGSFFADLHRGQCAPIRVGLAQYEDGLGGLHTLLARVDPDHLGDPPAVLELHPKHMFVDDEFWAEFVMSWVLDKGSSPVDQDGIMPTSHLRDPRAKVYRLRTFRQTLEAAWDRLVVKGVKTA